MSQPRVLIIGCGFGGLEAVRALSKAAVEITLVDRTNHHLFQPLLYQVAAAGLSAPAISAPIRRTLRRQRIDTHHTKVVLIEGSDRVLGAFVPEPSEKARLQLQRLHVDVRLGCKVTGIDADGVTYEVPHGNEVQVQRLASKTVIWAAGVAASPLGRVLAASTGATLDRAGRVVVEPDLSLPGHPEISVIGDLAAAKSFGRGDPKPVPGVSPAAKQMDRIAAANLLRRLRSSPTTPFRYIDYGNLATIGRKAAVVDLAVPPLGSLRFSGYFAWLFWLFAHIYFLIGFRNRLIVLMDWAWAYWTYERNARVVAQPAGAPKVLPPA